MNYTQHTRLFSPPPLLLLLLLSYLPLQSKLNPSIHKITNSHQELMYYIHLHIFTKSYRFLPRSPMLRDRQMQPPGREVPLHEHIQARLSRLVSRVSYLILPPPPSSNKERKEKKKEEREKGWGQVYFYWCFKTNHKNVDISTYSGFCSEESPDVKCCVDNSYDPNFRYASNEAAPSDWLEGLGMAQPDGQDEVFTTTNPIKKTGSGPFDSNARTGGYARSSPGDVMNNNGGQCECKSLEKSI